VTTTVSVALWPNARFVTTHAVPSGVVTRTQFELDVLRMIDAPAVLVSESVMIVLDAVTLDPLVTVI